MINNIKSTIQSILFKPNKSKAFNMPKIPTDSLDELELIFKLSASELKEYLINRLNTLNYNVQSEDGFIIGNPKSKNTTPVMFLAHMDTVHKKLCSEIWYTKDKDKWTATEGIGGDDRCGIWMILQTIIKSEKKPIVLFTEEEEIGGIGARKYVDYIYSNMDEKDDVIPDVDFLIEYDRANSNDAVYYDCDNKDFETFISSFGFETAWGSFSDISEIAPALGVAAVNISSGYYHPHTTSEYVVISEMINNVKRGIKIINSKFNTFEYVEKINKYSYSYKDYSCYGYGSYKEYEDDEYDVWGGVDKSYSSKKKTTEKENLYGWTETDYVNAYAEYENPEIVALNQINPADIASITTHNNKAFSSEAFFEMLLLDSMVKTIYLDKSLNVYVYESIIDAFVKVDNAAIINVFGRKINFDYTNALYGNSISQKTYEILCDDFDN